MGLWGQLGSAIPTLEDQVQENYTLMSVSSAVQQGWGARQQLEVLLFLHMTQIAQHSFRGLQESMTQQLMATNGDQHSMKQSVLTLWPMRILCQAFTAAVLAAASLFCCQFCPFLCLQKVTVFQTATCSVGFAVSRSPPINRRLF